ncbi:MAG: cobalt ECF transporter T component CbiQ [Desulfatibacillaceae bacterium]
MLEEAFAYGSSPVHRADPRVRLVYAVAYSFVVALSTEFAVLWAALAAGVASCVLARMAVVPLARRMAAVNVFVLFLWAVVPLTAGGEALATAGPFTVSREGVRLCGLITLRTNAVALTCFAMLATMPVARLGHAMHRLKAPAHLVHLLLMSHRYVFVLAREYQQMRRAAALRCFSPGANTHTYRTYAYLVGMLFVRATSRAQRVNKAMMCRGFSGTFHTLDELRFRGADAAWAIGFAAVLTVLALGGVLPVV